MKNSAGSRAGLCGQSYRLQLQSKSFERQMVPASQQHIYLPSREAQNVVQLPPPGSSAGYLNIAPKAYPLTTTHNRKSFNTARFIDVSFQFEDRCRKPDRLRRRSLKLQRAPTFEVFILQSGFEESGILRRAERTRAYLGHGCRLVLKGSRYFKSHDPVKSRLGTDGEAVSDRETSG